MRRGEGLVVRAGEELLCLYCKYYHYHQSYIILHTFTMTTASPSPTGDGDDAVGNGDGVCHSDGMTYYVTLITTIFGHIIYKKNGLQIVLQLSPSQRDIISIYRQYIDIMVNPCLIHGRVASGWR